MKKSKVLVPALGILVLSTAASITGTVAWFSVNNSVSVTGMTVTTKVSSNLLIAEDTLASNAKKAEADFGPGPLNQVVTGTLEPVSTINGSSFFYTTKGKADGSASTPASGDKYKAYGADFADDYGITGAVGYVDYVFQLKATNVTDAAQDIKLTNLTLTYAKAASETDNNQAFRTAIWVEDITSANPTGSVATVATGIYAPSGFVMQEAGKAVASTSATGALAVSYNALTKLGTVAADGVADYYKVVVRLYIEGEDKTCTNDTFVKLTGSWSLALDIELGGSNANVSELTLA